MPKVSVIIPVYNTEKYLKKCLDSVCNQTLSDIEIICIDDCSTDNSLNILKEYTLKDNRIKLIEFKENKGAAVARNTGIDEATGEYIGFIDSDDYPETELFYEQLYNNAKEKDADISKGAYKDSETGDIDETINAKIIENKNNFCSTYCSAIFRNDFIKDNNIKFPELRNMEDPVFAFSCALKANKVGIVPECNLIITKREDSITAKIPTLEQIKDKIKGLKLLFNLDENRIYSYVLAYWFVTVSLDSLNNQNSSVKRYVENELYFIFKLFNDNLKIKTEIDKINPDIFEYYLKYKASEYEYDIDKIKKIIDEVEIVSFDIFDTLLLRPFLKPTDLFYYMENSFKLYNFFQQRTYSENTMRQIKRIRKSNEEDITFNEIYKNLDKKYPKAKELECELEHKLLQCNKKVFDIYNYAVEKGKRIIIVSDMYHSSAFLSTILKDKGIKNFEKLYVSSEIGVCKATGNMYSYVLNDLNIAPEKIVHIGDNKISDYQKAKEKGIRTICCENFIDKNKSNPFFQQMMKIARNDFSVSVVLGINNIIIQNENECVSYWEWFARFLGGVLLFFFVNEVHKIVNIRNLTDIFFIARDGFLLKKGYEYLFNTENIKTHYVYASRKLKDLSIKDNDLYSAETRLEYNNYINNLNLNGNNIGIVDTCAGEFSAQKLIQTFMPTKNILGIYFASYINYEYNYINLTNKRHINNEIGFNWDIIEFLLSSDEPPIENIRYCKPVYRKELTENDKQVMSIFGLLQTGEFDFIQTIHNLFEAELPDITFTTVINIFKTFYKNLNFKDKTMLHTINHPIDSKQRIYKSLYDETLCKEMEYANV